MSYDGTVRIYKHDIGSTADTEITEWVDVSSINITAGRTTVTEQPSPSVASFTVYTQAGENPVPLAINERVRIMTFGTVDSVYGTCWFIGRVSDSSVNVQAWRNGSGLIATTYTCVSDLAYLNRFEVGAAGYSKQFDGDRIEAIAADCGVNVGTLPNTYEIAVYSGGATNALGLAQEAANSAKGILYDFIYLQMGTWNSRIEYNGALDRLSNTIYTLTNDDINALGLVFDATINECATVVKVTNASGSGTTYTAASTYTSAYGYRYGTRSTTLHNLTDANTLGQELLAAKQEPKYKVKQINLNLANPALTGTTLDLFLRPDLGTHLSFTLPDPLNSPNLFPVGFEGFIEGYSVQFARNDIRLTLNLSNFGDLYPYTYWSTAETSTTDWQTAYTATTTWSDVI